MSSAFRLVLSVGLGWSTCTSTAAATATTCAEDGAAGELRGLDGCCKFAGGMFGRLGDEKHTVAKAELAALLKTLELLKKTGGDGCVTIWTDCRYVSEGVGNAVWSRSSIASHGDKWVGVGRLLNDIRQERDGAVDAGARHGGARGGGSAGGARRCG